jgi:16S rRNA A1518/A1519 N6-dimethyltransferase RsmA/KsgA/DIM1 with predicted DNA glycosylase/AP lyase activity
MIKNILKSMGYSAEKLESLDKKFDLKVRPEKLSVEQITELYNLLER